MTTKEETPAGEAPGPAAEASGFAKLGLLPELLSTLEALGYEEPTPIQREAIPALLAGRDLVGQAATGTGKTAAFALPMLHRLEPTKPKPWTPRAMVLVPTRELAMQVAEAIHKYGKARRATVLPSMAANRSASSCARSSGDRHRGRHPGRAVDHIERGTLLLEAVEMLVLDEADEMLDMGFAEDLDAILERTPRRSRPRSSRRPCRRESCRSPSGGSRIRFGWRSPTIR